IHEVIGTGLGTADSVSRKRTTDSGSPARTADGEERARTVNGGTSNDTAGNGVQLDSLKSIEQLIQDGTLKQNELAMQPEEVESRTEILKDGEKPTIEVRFAEEPSQGSDQKPKADFTIGTDGSVQVLNDPETSKDGHIVIELERPGDPTAGPTSQQEK